MLKACWKFYESSWSIICSRVYWDWLNCWTGLVHSVVVERTCTMTNLSYFWIDREMIFPFPTSVNLWRSCTLTPREIIPPQGRKPYFKVYCVKALIERIVHQICFILYYLIHDQIIRFTFTIDVMKSSMFWIRHWFFLFQYFGLFQSICLPIYLTKENVSGFPNR
jgi:hypothetical protein